MNLNLITAPQTEPLTLEDVEGQVRLPGQLSDEAAAVEMMITAIREQAEAVTRRALITQVHELVLDGFPSGRQIIVLPKPPLQTVESIVYTDVDGVEQTLDLLSYRVITQTGPTAGYGYVMPIYGLTWPTALNDIATVKIRFKCGYGPLVLGESDNIPLGIKQWMLINIANIFENRETVVVGSGRESLIDMTETLADGLLANFRLHRL